LSKGTLAKKKSFAVEFSAPNHAIRVMLDKNFGLVCFISVVSLRILNNALRRVMRFILAWCVLYQ